MTPQTSNKTSNLVIMILLVVALIITTWGWISAENRVNELELGTIGEYEEALAGCETMNTVEELDACDETLRNFRTLLDTYRDRLENILERRQQVLEGDLPGDETGTSTDDMATGTPQS